jgi:aarF domain-containing kinase
MYPIYVHYRAVDIWTKFKNYSPEERDAAFEELHPMYGEKIYDITEKLKGFYIKLGQLGASRPDMLPDSWVEKLRNLEDDCPHEEFHIIEEIICKDFGVDDISEIFEYIDKKPLGAASIGQAHYAILKGGKEVVIKIKFPNVEELFRGDFAVARKFCALAQPAHLPLLKETEKQFKTEFDYRLEAENLELIYKNLGPGTEWEDKVIIPKPYPELSAENCLVMDYVRGVKLIKALTRNLSAVAQSRGMTIDELIEEQKRLKHAPTARELEWYRMQMRARDMAWNALAWMINATFGQLFRALGNANGARIIDYKATPIMLNVKAILDIILDVHGYQLFVNGAFNGDCHPGNIILTDDGKICLIDFGQVKRLTRDLRKTLSKLCIALSDDDDEKIFDVAMSEMSLRTKNMNKFVLLQHCKFFLDRDDEEFTEGMNVQMYFEHLDSIDPIVQLDDDFVMVSRMRILLSGLCHALGYDMRFAKVWRKYAERCLAVE